MWHICTFCELFSLDKLMQRSVGKSTRGRAACSAVQTKVFLSYWLNTLAFCVDDVCLLEKQGEKSACMLTCHELWSDMLAHSRLGLIIEGSLTDWGFCPIFILPLARTDSVCCKVRIEHDHTMKHAMVSLMNVCLIFDVQCGHRSFVY